MYGLESVRDPGCIAAHAFANEIRCIIRLDRQFPQPDGALERIFIYQRSFIIKLISACLIRIGAINQIREQLAQGLALAELEDKIATLSPRGRFWSPRMKELYLEPPSQTLIWRRLQAICKIFVS